MNAITKTLPRPSWYRDINLADFSVKSPPIPVIHLTPTVGGFHTPQEQSILRMMVRKPGGQLVLPGVLEWLEWPIRVAIARQQALGLDIDRFIYITVRIGPVFTKTDDVWHVDGFSTRIAHWPEQNYVWCDHTPTQYLDQAIPIEEGFNPLRHNIHTYFQDRVNTDSVRTMDAKWMYLIDPYLIHRRPPSTSGQLHRSFFRITFVPIEIEDDTCHQNPRLPSGPYNREDIRNQLERFQ